MISYLVGRHGNSPKNSWVTSCDVFQLNMVLHRPTSTVINAVNEAKLFEDPVHYRTYLGVDLL